MSVFTWANQWLADQLVEHASEDVVYWRGDDPSDPIPVTVGQTSHDLGSHEAAFIQTKTVDFLVSRERLDIPGLGVIEPRAGDVIERVSLPGKPRFRVSSPSGSDDVAEIIDPQSCLMWRIHTVEED